MPTQIWYSNEETRKASDGASALRCALRTVWDSYKEEFVEKAQGVAVAEVWG
jgi:hypothetical protein